ncbi:MAG: DUF885 domain-containing protein [bacterium]
MKEKLKQGILYASILLLGATLALNNNDGKKAKHDSFSGPVTASSSGQQTAASAIATSSAANNEFRALAENYYEEFLQLNPLQATLIGDNRYNHLLLVDISEAHRAKLKTLFEKYLAKAAKLDRDRLAAVDQISYDMLKRELAMNVAGFEFPDHLIPINHLNCLPANFPELVTGARVQPFKSVKDYDDFLKRTSAFSEWIEVSIQNMKKGVARGVVQPRTVIELSLPQWQAQVVDEAKKSPFYQPVAQMPTNFSETEKARLTKAYTEAIQTKIIPAYKKLHDFLKNEYLPKTRSTISLSSLPNGKAWYAYNAKFFTTTPMSPDEIFDLGMKEAQRISEEMQTVIKRLGFEGTIAQFMPTVQQNRAMQITDKDSIFIIYRQIRTKIEAQLPKLFGALPKADFEIKPVEEFRAKTFPGGAYMPAAADGSRPGVFYVNASLPTYPRHIMTALFLHEALPGHHMQIAVGQEQESMPRFRRFGYYGAYIEGWGLYCESLGKEMGLYDDVYQYLGMLMMEMGRACRLVGDAGIHYKGWTKDEAIKFLNENTHGFGINEIDRFTAAPGQALSYKIGQLQLLELRRRAEKKLGAKFDLREFHDRILLNGSMPLDILENNLNVWISGK